jgi:hypothetical protein
MDAELTALTQTAGTTFVTLLATDAWQLVRDRIARLWQRRQPYRAEAVVAELAVSREEVLVAQAAGDDETLGELCVQWQGRVRRLLAAEPEAIAELRDLLRDLGPSTPGEPPSVTQYGTASGHARIYQAGRDQRINEP